MTSRVVFTIFIDQSDDELDYQPPFPGETENKNIKAKRGFIEYTEWLMITQWDYAQSIGAEHRKFWADDEWRAYYDDMKTRYPFMTTYLIINFYKIHLMYELSKEFDEVLYLDLDVVPLTSESFFEAHDLNKGIAVYKSALKSEYRTTRQVKNMYKVSNRSPEAKYWNTYALLDHGNHEGSNMVYNTGIIGANRKNLEKLAYFDDFDNMISLMTEVKDEPDSMWPKPIQNAFGWDNETVFGYYMALYKVPEIELDRKWHHIIDNHNYVTEGAKFAHVINKNFEWMKDWYDKNII